MPLRMPTSTEILICFPQSWSRRLCERLAQLHTSHQGRMSQSTVQSTVPLVDHRTRVRVLRRRLRDRWAYEWIHVSVYGAYCSTYDIFASWRRHVGVVSFAATRLWHCLGFTRRHKKLKPCPVMFSPFVTCVYTPVLLYHSPPGARGGVRVR